MIVEATTSWAYVGAGLRILTGPLGPEYAMEFSSLNTGLKVFLRAIYRRPGRGPGREAERRAGPMPVVEDEAGIYGYPARTGTWSKLSATAASRWRPFHDGVAVVEMLMALYRSAEIGHTVRLPARELETYVPPVARS